MALTINKQPTGGALTLCNSPILIETSSTQVTQDDFKFEVEVYIWTGASSAMPSDPTYTLSKLPNTSNNNRALFDLSKLFQDEIEQPLIGSMTARVVNSSNAVWGKVVCKGVWDGGSESTTGNGFYVTSGYSYTEQETINGNHDHDDSIGLVDYPSDMRIYGSQMYIPVYTPHHDYVRVTDGTTTHTEDLTSKTITNSTERIVYVDILDICSVERIEGESITVTLLGDTNVQYTFKKPCVTKYEPIPVVFVNKFGVLEQIYLEGAMRKSMTAETERYNRPMFYNGVSVSMARNTGGAYNHKAKVTYNLNTGIMHEDFNHNMEQLAISESVWVEVDSVWRFVRVADTSLAYKTSLNDRIIQYAVTLEEVNDYINQANV